MKLSLGVVDTPYTGEKDSLTTGDVAEILEEHYHVIETFYELHEEEIAVSLGGHFKDSLESLLTGGPGITGDVLLDDVKLAFDRFITEKEMDGLGIPGVPTQASLDGVNHRMKHPYEKRASRPSFRDTGEYLNSFLAWLNGGS